MQNALTNTVDVNAGHIVPIQTITADMFTRYVAYLDVSPKSIETYKRALKSFAEYLQQNGITRPTRTDIITYRDDLKATHKPTTVNLYIIAVRSFFEWTEQENIYPNVADHIKGAKISREPKKDALTVEQVKDILSNIDTSTVQGLRDYAIIVTAITCGLRTIELARLTVADIRTNGNTLVLEVQGKGREDTESVVLPLQTYKVILSYLNTRTDATDNSPLFASVSNKNVAGAMTTRSISRIIKNAFIDAGYNTERLTAHTCRHTAVTLALLGNEDIQAVQQFARHKNIATTLIYAHNLEKLNNTCTGTIATAIL